MYCACQVTKMLADNLGPTASGMNFGKYSAQNDVCSFDYSTSVRLIRTNTDQAFQFLQVFALLLVSKATQPLLLCITTLAGKRSENQSEGAIWHEWASRAGLFF